MISYYQSVKRTLYSSLGIYDRIVNSDNHVNVIEYDYLGSAKESVIRLFFPHHLCIGRDVLEAPAPHILKRLLPAHNFQLTVCRDGKKLLICSSSV